MDTSTTSGSCGLIEHGKPLQEFVWERDQSHSEILTAKIELLFKNSAKKMSDIDGIGVCIGPGSFTGIRLSVSVAKALAFALAKNIYAVDSLSLLANGVPRTNSGWLVAVRPAQRNLVYSATFDLEKGGPVDLRAVAKAGSIETLLAELEGMTGPIQLVGEASTLVFDLSSESLRKRLCISSLWQTAGPSLMLALMIESGGSLAMVWKEAEALYIRSSEAEERLQEVQK